MDSEVIKLCNTMNKKVDKLNEYGLHIKKIDMNANIISELNRVTTIEDDINKLLEVTSDIYTFIGDVMTKSYISSIPERNMIYLYDIEHFASLPPYSHVLRDYEFYSYSIEAAYKTLINNMLVPLYKSSMTDENSWNNVSSKILKYMKTLLKEAKVSVPLEL